MQSFAKRLLICVAFVFSTTLVVSVNGQGPGRLQPAPGQMLQFGFGTLSKPRTVVVLRSPNREAQQALRRGRDALKEERFNDAAGELGGILADETREDFFFVTEASLVSTSMRGDALRLLAELPAKGRDAYELQFGAEAKLLLDEGLQAGHLGKLEEVTRRFPYTNAGGQASLLLARHFLDINQPFAAIATLRQPLASDVQREQLDPEISLLSAAAWKASGDTEKALQSLRELRARSPKSSFKIGGEEIALFAEDGEAEAWLSNLLGSLKLANKAKMVRWTMFRGDRARNAAVHAGRPLLQAQWEVAIPNSQADRLRLDELRKSYALDGKAAIPGLHPLVFRHPSHDGTSANSREVVLARTPRRLVAVDFETGNRIWYYPSYDRSKSDNLQSSTASSQTSSSGGPLQQRTWADAPYGQICSDGRRVFFVDSLGVTDPSTPSTRILLGGRFIRDPLTPKTFNQLVALELHREGANSWSIDGQTGLLEGLEPIVEKRLAGAFFLGCPLVDDEVLYVLAEIRGEVKLVSLDAKTGKLRWTQQICQVDSPFSSRSVARRTAGASPSMAEGVIVCPTSSGAVVAIDAATRGLRWGFQYMKTTSRSTPTINQLSSRAMAGRLGETWADATVTLADGKVLLTPVESPQLYCLNMLDGKLAWPAIPREDMLYVACVHTVNEQPAAVMVGSKSLRAFRLSDGKRAWEDVKLPEGVLPSGRGSYSGEYYLLPTTKSTLLKIDLNSGKIVANEPTDGVLGNIICHQGRMISQGVSSLKSFYQLEPLEQLVPQRLAKNPNDSWALARRGELLLRDGKHNEAIKSLQAAFEHCDDEYEKHGIRSLLVHTALAALEADFASNRELVEMIEPFVEQASQDQRGHYLRLTAMGLQRIGQRATAFQTYLKLIALDQSPVEIANLSTGPIPMDNVEADLLVRRDRWIRSQIGELLANANPKDRQEMDAAIRKRFEESKIDEGSLGKVSLLGRFISHFGAHPLGDEARLELASRLVATSHLLKAELLLTQLEGSSNIQVAGRSTALLAKIYQSVQRNHEAADCYRLLGSRYRDVIFADGKTGAELAALASDSTPMKQSKKLEGAYPWGLTKPSKIPPSESLTERLFPASVTEMKGHLPEGLSVQVTQAQSVVLNDGFGREFSRVELRGESVRMQMNYAFTHAKMYGHLLLLSTGTELCSLNTLQPTSDRGILWRTLLRRPVGRITASVVVKEIPNEWGHRRFRPHSGAVPVGDFGPVTPDGVCFQRFRQIVCADPTQPEVVYWSRDGFPHGCSLFGDEQLLFVVPQNATEATVLSTVDGRLLGKCAVPNDGDRWLTMGRRVLSAGADPDHAGHLLVRVLDPWDSAKGTARKDPVVWQERFNPKSKATICKGNLLAVVEPGEDANRFVLVDLASQKKIVDAATDLDTGIRSLYVIPSKDNFVLVTNRSTAASAVSRRAVYSSGSSLMSRISPLLEGQLYAFDRKTGSPLWPAPVDVLNFGLPLNQPSELPVITFVTTISNNSRPGSAGRTGVVCIDKRDGRAVLADESDGQSRYFRIEGEPASNRVEVKLQNEIYSVEFTDEPHAPAGPAVLDPGQPISIPGAELSETQKPEAATED